MAGKKLLVADDSLTIQKVIRLALSNEGYEIQAVSDGNDAVEQIPLFQPDLVLIDISLPSKSAFEVKRTINEHSHLGGTSFVLMSSAFEKVDEAQAKEVGFHGRLTKPFDPAHLRQVLSEVLAAASLRAPAPAPAKPAERREVTKSIMRPAPTPSAPTYTPPTPAYTAPAPEPIFTPPPPASEVMPEIALEASSDSDIKNLTESTIRMSGLDDFQWSVNEPSLKPSEPGISVQLETPVHEIRHEPEFAPMPPVQTHSHAAASVAPIDEAMVRRQLEETLERMANKLFPEIAERVIRQEIHKLLSEQH